MSLTKYLKKRNFANTSEPNDTGTGNGGSQSLFVIQKHDASHLHYDFRLEVAGVLKSWAVPKGPSLNPKDKRLAMMVEDHPFSYRSFEGVIPKGSYGAGEVIVWDNGTYSVEGIDKKRDQDKYMLEAIDKGDLKIVLHGQKLNGKFALVKMHGKEDNAWLLIKEHDEFETTDNEFSDVSVISEQQLTRDLSTKERADSEPESSISLPKVFSPMLATLVDKPFTDPNWIFEPKLDGYRALAFVDHQSVQLYSRNQKSLNKKFSQIVKTLEQLPFQAVLDGEVVGLDDKGNVDFQMLQNATDHQAQLRYCVFDIVFLQGHDLSQLELIDRKKLLKKAIEKLKNVQFVDGVKNGEKLFAEAEEKGYEGIIAKKIDSLYKVDTRSEEWLKIKVTHTQDAIICGYTMPQGQRNHFGSLLLGIYENNILHYVGHTGTGFHESDLALLKRVFDNHTAKHSPFDSLPESVTDHDVTWLKPEIVCEVKYSQWTHDNILRHAVYQRIREDKDPLAVQLEQPKPTKKELSIVQETEKKESVRLTHPEKIYWPKLGLTKKDLLEYYAAVGPIILPYLKDRPESLNRHPNGVADHGFFQKDITFETPDFVDLVTIDSDDVGEVRYLVCNNLETLSYMANLGCIEINPWNSRVGSLDCPDYFVIDLDPLDVPFSKVVKVAKVVKKILDKAKMTAYCKTSGKKGIHIFIPLHGKYETELSSNFAKLIATLVYKELPEITSLERSPSSRHSKVYVDFLQNRKGQTIAAPYSLRPTEDATASTPLKWEELTDSLDPKQFTIKTLPKRIHKLGDVWNGILNEKNDLKAALKNLSK